MLKESSTDNPASVRLRAVVPEDEDFLLRVYSSTRAEEMARLPWNDAQRDAFLRMQFKAQQQHYDSYYRGVSHEIIERAGQAVGRLYVSREDDRIRILDITILPEFRNAGIGTPLLADLMEEAVAAGKSLDIYVENYNPSVRLFERLGFVKVEDDGLNLLLEWNRKSGSAVSKESAAGPQS